MSEKQTMQVANLELRLTDTGWQYMSEGLGNESDRWCHAADALSPFTGSGVNGLLDELADAKAQIEKLVAESMVIKQPGSSEFEKGRLAEQDRLATELFNRGGFATLQLSQSPDHIPRMKFVDPSETRQVDAVRIGNGILLVRKPT
jgi:hypothetical protein